MNIKNRIIRGAVYGGIFAVWIGFWFIGVVSGWFLFGLDVPDTLLNAKTKIYDWVIGNILLDFPSKFISSPLYIFISLCIAGIIIGIFLSLLLYVFKIDEDNYSVQSVKWAGKKIISGKYLFLIFLLLIPFLIFIFLDMLNISFYLSIFLIGLSVSVCLLALLSIPVILCRPEIGGQFINTNWWKGPYQNIKTVLVFYLLYGFTFLIKELIYFIENRLFSAIFLILIIFAIDPFVEIIRIALFYRRSLKPVTQVNKYLRFRYYGSMFKLKIVLNLLLIFISIPVFSFAVIVWKWIPSIAAHYRSINLTLPLFWRIFLHTFNFLSNYGSLLILPSVIIFYCLCLARLGWLLKLHREPESS